jgi:hypothetical protein
MTDHRIIGDSVRVVTYSNGVTIYLNYGDKSANVGAIEILPLSYYIDFSSS